MLKERLENMLKGNESELEKEVITDLLEYLGDESEEDLISYVKDIINHGCISGVVSKMIYYIDTKKFFIKHMDEILELYSDLKEDLGSDPLKEVNSNNLAWLGYEETVRKIADNLEIEY